MHSLQEMAQQFIKEIFEVDILEEGFAQTSEKVLKITKAFVLDLMKHKLESTDQTLADNPDLRPEWNIHKKVPRVQETLLGTLSYTRRYYVNKRTSKRAFLLDVLVGIEKHERINQGLKAALCNQAVLHSYQMSSSIACEGRVSKQSVMRVLQEVDIPEIEIKPSKEAMSVIHIQADEDHVPVQDGRRHREVKLAVIHEPSYRVGKKGILPNKIHKFAYKGSVEHFWSDLADRVDQRYPNVENLRIYLHGDGANWIQSGLDWLPNSHFVLDRFHVWQALKQIAPADSTEYLELRDSLFDVDKEEFKRLVKLCQKLYDKDPERVKEAENYILKNWKGIKIWTKDPKSGLSCAEGLVSHCLSERLSMRPMAWMDDGLGQMTKLRENYFNGGRITCLDFERSRKQRLEIEAIGKSVKLEKLQNMNEASNVFSYLPLSHFNFPKRDARYELFKRISEGGKAI